MNEEARAAAERSISEIKLLSEMSLSCFRSSDPNISTVNLLYDAKSENGHLYSGRGAPPLCSSTSRPPPSGCVVCFDQIVHAACADLLEDVTLVMEGAGQHIDIMESECPRLLGDGDWPLWLFILISVLVAVLVIVVTVVFCKLQKCRRTPKNMEVAKSEVDPTDEKLVAEAAV